jgi:hypothetical protein
MIHVFRIKKTTPKIKPFVSIDGVEVDIENTQPGSITLEQYRKVRANSPGFDMLYSKLDNEALAEAVRNNLSNCSPKSNVIYEGALQNILVPELIKRLAGEVKGHKL